MNCQKSFCVCIVLTCMQRKIGIFIPCYNVEKSIEAVLKSFTQKTLDRISEIVITDNCSSDHTFNKLQELRKLKSDFSKKLTIIKNLENYGLGGSQKIAYRYFTQNNFSHFMIIHGDNQGNPEEIAQRFLTKLDENPEMDVIFASRFTSESSLQGYSVPRVLGNHFFNLLTWFLTGLRMSDAGTGIILYRTKALEKYPYMELSNFFHFNPQLNILLFEDPDLKFMNVPLNWRDSKDGSNISPLFYCWILLKILLRYGYSKYLLRRPGIAGLKREEKDFKPRFEMIQPEF